MEKVIENENIEEITEKNFYSDFIHQNFSEEFFNKYKSKQEQELKQNFYKIISEGIASDAINYEINLGFIDFSDDSDYSTMLDCLSPDTDITSLLIASNPNFNEQVLNNILKAFSCVKAFKNLYIYNSGLQGNFLADPIAELIKTDHLETLHLSNNSLNDVGLATITANFQQSKNLINLTLTNIGISHSSYNALGSIVLNCENLKFLNISDCDISIQRDSEFNFLKDVKIKGNSNDNDNGNSVNFLTAISKSSSIQNLSLINCMLGREAVYIMQALENNSSTCINLVDLTENNIGSEDFKDLLNSLRNLKLQYLKLNQNNISDLGFFHLYDYLEATYPKNTKNLNYTEKVQFLDLEQNDITDKGAKILISIIQSDFFYLKNLNLKFNKVSSSIIGKIADTLVEYSKQSQLKLDIEKSGLYNIFNILNISQIGIDLSKNFNVSDDEYNSIFRDKINNEYQRFFYN
jgi:hypothetical protein